MAVLTLLIILSFVILEFILRVANPYRLFIDKFDESKFCQFDPILGWRPKSNVHFKYYHKYLATRRVSVFQNSLGLPSKLEYTKKKPADVDFRILIFGETTCIGWELREDKRIYALLEKKLKLNFDSRIEIIPIMARNFCSSQLYSWFMTVFKDFEYDLIIYNFNENNPRRSVTFHESGKPIALSQPLLVFEDGQANYIKPPNIVHPNDMAYLDSSFNSIYLPGRTDKSLISTLKRTSHIYQLVEDFFLGNLRLRKYNDRNEIKDIEKWSIGSSFDEPYQWSIFKNTIEAFLKNKHSHASFLIIPNLQYYHAGNNWLKSSTKHPWGFTYETIPSRVHLKQLSQKADLTFCDIYKFVYEKNIDTSTFYINPRYAYYSENGAEFHSDFIIHSLTNLSLIS